jgi:hypothetical protein
MRLKSDSKHKISPEFKARSLVMAGKLDAGNAMQLLGKLDMQKVVPKMKDKK